MSQRSLRPPTLALLISVLVGGLDTARPAHATERPPVSVGEVRVSTDAATAGAPVVELGRTLRAALNEELGRVAGLGPVKHPLIVSATLVRLSSERTENRDKAHATISLALRRADDQVLFAELRGDARVEEASENLPALRRFAVQRAVHGALARLPEAVQRSR